MLKKRKPVIFGKGLKAVPKQWKKLLRDNEQLFLTDNQLSVFVDRNRAGVTTHFYPLPFSPYKSTEKKWNFEDIANHDSLRSTGPTLDFEPKDTILEFYPHIIKKILKADHSRIIERCAINGNVFIIEWDFSGLDTAVMNFSLPYFNAEVKKIRNGIFISIKDKVFAALSISGAAGLSFDIKEKPFQCKADIRIHKGKKIYLVYSVGYNRNAVINSVSASLKNPGYIFHLAEKTWDDYFTKIVPHFSCSDKMLEKLYYYCAYTIRANLYDIPYEPFTHPYTCPWKTACVWQWSWNSAMDSICERWLNDKKIGAGGILLEGSNAGGLNKGTYLRPLKKVTRLRNNDEYNQKLGEYMKRLPPKYDLIPLSVIPHTTANGLLGAWEFYLCSGDKKFLKDAFAVMVEAESEFSKHELETGLCTCTFVDEFDYSLRLKPFIKNFKKGDPIMHFKLDTPFIAIDYNCYLYFLREKIIEVAAIIGADFNREKLLKKNLKLKDAINKFLWCEKDGFYYDADPRNMKHSGVKCITGIAAPLYSGIASSSQASRLVEHLVDPKEFGTSYPCPSIALNTPGIDPSLPTYGGDVLIASGIWFTVEGLVRYGYKELAAKYILKTIEMVSKEGPSSSYSYHSVTGKYNQDKHTLSMQCMILMDLICKYIIGIIPQPEGKFKIDSIVLSASGIRNVPLLEKLSLRWFTFGPYNFCGKNITIRWNDKRGYRDVKR